MVHDSGLMCLSLFSVCSIRTPMEAIRGNLLLKASTRLSLETPTPFFSTADVLHGQRAEKGLGA